MKGASHEGGRHVKSPSKEMQTINLKFVQVSESAQMMIAWRPIILKQMSRSVDRMLRAQD